MFFTGLYFQYSNLLINRDLNARKLSPYTLTIDGIIWVLVLKCTETFKSLEGIGRYENTHTLTVNGCNLWNYIFHYSQNRLVVEPYEKINNNNNFK